MAVFSPKTQSPFKHIFWQQTIFLMKVCLPILHLVSPTDFHQICPCISLLHFLDSVSSHRLKFFAQETTHSWWLPFENLYKDLQWKSSLNSSSFNPGRSSWQWQKLWACGRVEFKCFEQCLNRQTPTAHRKNYNNGRLTKHWRSF